MRQPDDSTAVAERELTAERAHLLGLWDARAPELHRDDESSRTAWVKARETFFDEVGPIPPDSEARAKLRALKDRYRGERIFVIGNGPSLNRTALHLLEDEFTFGVNRIYLMFDRIGWRPTFYTTLDWRVAPDSVGEINALEGMQLFFPERFRGLLRDGPDVTWYWNDRARLQSEQGFASDASLGIRGAGSVTGAAIQLAFHMGFDPIHLIGCDVSYSVPDTVVQEGPDKFGTGVKLYLTSTEDDDSNHFDKRYFGAGKRWHDPNVKRMIQGFSQCEDGARRHGRVITNATEGGQLEVFERTPFRSLFGEATLPAPSPTLASFIVASLAEPRERLMVDIGAGAGSHLAPFAALGWEVRAFEPCARARQELRNRTPRDWNLFIDPRAVDRTTGTMDAFADPGWAGVSLAMASDDSSQGPRIDTADPGYALEPAGDRVPGVVAIDANDWEAEILNSWPFDQIRPEWLIVGVDDRSSPRFGFNRRSIFDKLTSLDYQVIAVDHGLAFVPDSAWLDTGDARPVTLVAGPTRDDWDAIGPALAGAHRVALESAHGRPSDLPEPTPSTGMETYARGLQQELALLRGSTSWRVGSGIVQTSSRALDRVNAAKRRLGQVTRRGRE